MRFASKDLQNDKEVVLAAVNQNGESLRFASKDLQNDKDIVLDAISKRAISLQYASKELQRDLDCLFLLTEYHKNPDNEIIDKDYEKWFLKVTENFDILMQEKIMQDIIPKNNAIGLRLKF